MQKKENKTDVSNINKDEFLEHVHELVNDPEYGPKDYIKLGDVAKDVFEKNKYYFAAALKTDYKLRSQMYYSKVTAEYKTLLNDVIEKQWKRKRYLDDAIRTIQP